MPYLTKEQLGEIREGDKITTSWGTFTVEAVDRANEMIIFPEGEDDVPGGPRMIFFEFIKSHHKLKIVDLI